jgi:hypothetical protein
MAKWSCMDDLYLVLGAYILKETGDSVEATNFTAICTHVKTTSKDHKATFNL